MMNGDEDYDDDFVQEHLSTHSVRGTVVTRPNSRGEHYTRAWP